MAFGSLKGTRGPVISRCGSFFTRSCAIYIWSFGTFFNRSGPSPMRHLLLLLAILVAVACVTSSQFEKRCQSVCNRSDGQDFCQRCRMRVPMRFGKRTTDRDFERENGNAPRWQNDKQALLDAMENFARQLQRWDRNYYNNGRLIE